MELSAATRRRKAGRRMALAVAACLLATLSLIRADTEPPRTYTYAGTTASNGVRLHYMRTTPDRIELQAVAANVAETISYGINGGFFYEGDILSIAVQNHRPVKGEPGQYGSGWFNVKYARGTLVWDAAANRLSVQAVRSADELLVTDQANYWAQGGVSMNLQDEASWTGEAAAQALPLADSLHMRSGMIYDEAGSLYLIVSPTPCTAEQFRTAILERIAPDLGKEGIFLDGDGSSQMRSAEISLPGDLREVYQMIAVK